MKYCEKCGAEMNDDALFCSKCGAKVEVKQEEKPAEESTPEVEQVKESAPKQKIKQKTAIHEQKVKEFLPVSAALIVCSIIIWIINSVGHLTGIAHVMPLLIFMLLSGFLAAISMIRAVKTLRRKIYFNSVLSFVLFALLLTCLIIDFVILIKN